MNPSRSGSSSGSTPPSSITPAVSCSRSPGDGAFAVGLGGVGTESGTDEFATDVPARNAFEDGRRGFGDPFAVPTGSTSLIRTERNVLARPSLLRMLRTRKALADRTELRVVDTSSPARAVARQLDPEATTLEARIDAAVASVAERPGFSNASPMTSTPGRDRIGGDR